MTELRLTLDRDENDRLLIVDAETGDTVATLADTALAASLARTLVAAPALLAELETCVYWLDQLAKTPNVPISNSIGRNGHDAILAARGGVRQ